MLLEIVSCGGLRRPAVIGRTASVQQILQVTLIKAVGLAICNINTIWDRKWYRISQAGRYSSCAIVCHGSWHVQSSVNS